MNIIAWVSGREINDDLDKNGDRICPPDSCLYTVSYIVSDGSLKSSAVIAASVLKTEAELQLDLKNAAVADANAKRNAAMTVLDVKLV